ncbi:MAG: hypothetical protein MUF00_18060 [Gemmatimonadaceae bacterium]|jgi:hypothetical protein|nr:hypothetical protein [Gemmatimonadaceae bacterium]
MSGRKSKRKGDRIERELVARHRALGLAAQRVPLSGAAGGLFAGDVLVPGVGRIEVKARAQGSGFVTLTRWLGTADALVLRQDHAEPLVVLPWATYSRLVALLADDQASGGASPLSSS